MERLFRSRPSRASLSKAKPFFPSKGFCYTVLLIASAGAYLYWQGWMALQPTARAQLEDVVDRLHELRSAYVLVHRQSKDPSASSIIATAYLMPKYKRQYSKGFWLICDGMWVYEVTPEIVNVYRYDRRETHDIAEDLLDGPIEDHDFALVSSPVDLNGVDAVQIDFHWPVRLQGESLGDSVVRNATAVKNGGSAFYKLFVDAKTHLPIKFIPDAIAPIGGIKDISITPYVPLSPSDFRIESCVPKALLPTLREARAFASKDKEGAIIQIEPKLGALVNRELLPPSYSPVASSP